MDTAIAIDRMHQTHNHRYEYNCDCESVSTKTIITIICPIHGRFNARIHDHLYKKSGCPECANQAKRNNFIDLAVAKYGQLYDYSRVTYEANNKAVVIGCKIHGWFDQLPHIHLSSVVGCPQCKTQQRTATIGEFIEKAKRTHGDAYDYSASQYVNCKTKITIVCKHHGEFEQTPDNHIRGAGCPKCAGDTLRGKYVASYHTAPDKVGYLYLVEFSNNSEQFIKVGITSRRKVSYRYGNNHAGYNVTYLREYKMSIMRANAIEQQLLAIYSDHKHTPLCKFGGHTECLKIDADVLISAIQQMTKDPS